MFREIKNSLVFIKEHETLKIEPWGKNSLRIRSTVNAEFTKNDWGLTEKVKSSKAKIIIDGQYASVKNGSLEAKINDNGILTFYKNGQLILSEYFRSYDPRASKESICLKIKARDFKGIVGGDYKLSVRFNPNDGEKIYGMGQYQMPYLDLKGCCLELAQRNSQVSIPFYVSSLGYGFLWNNPAVGHADFAKNMTEWFAESTSQMDYWITAEDTPAKIIENYTAATGRAPVMPSKYYGFWQCKLRYRTQEEVLTIARKYKELGIHLDVMVIDFFHWPRQGDWGFDKEYWPDPKTMCDELHSMGTEVMVSIWPSVDKKCTHYAEMKEKGYLIRTEMGTDQTYDFNGDCLTFDATNPEARKYLWKICEKNYAKYGIDIFWLDNAEPDYNVYDFGNYRYYMGTALSCSNLYPKLYSQAFFDGMTKSGKKNFINLERSGWVGSQKLAQVLWNGDVQSTWECLRDSVVEGINIGLAGIPWWTTDIGGFMNGNVNDPAFVELLERWFEFAVFTPVLRLHGDRDPHDIPPLDKDPERGYGGGYLFTGQPNEIWTYGEEAQKIMEKQIKLRESLKPYIGSIMKEASKNGSPLIRAMFYEFPEDEKCWDLTDQYMFGPEYLVAPVLTAGCKERKVYLPQGKWKNIYSGEITSGGKTITVKTPVDMIPVFQKIVTEKK